VAQNARKNRQANGAASACRRVAAPTVVTVRLQQAPSAASIRPLSMSEPAMIAAIARVSNAQISVRKKPKSSVLACQRWLLAKCASR